MEKIIEKLKDYFSCKAEELGIEAAFLMCPEFSYSKGRIPFSCKACSSKE